MPTIRVDEDVFAGLKALAEPFVDTPNSVIRRLISQYSNQVDVKSTASKIKSDNASIEKNLNKSLNLKDNELTPQPIYEQFLVYVLATEFKGRATKTEATKAVIKLMKSRGFINNADNKRVSTGETKAENTIAWGRNALKDEGFIKPNSTRGVWELTSEGEEHAKSINLPENKT